MPGTDDVARPRKDYCDWDADRAGASNGGSEDDIEAGLGDGDGESELLMTAAGASNGGSEVVIDMGDGSGTELVAPGDRDVESFSRPQRPVATIPKIRERLHRVAGDLFTPQTVLIGPYHRRLDSSFRWTEEEKKKAVDHLKRLLGETSFEHLKHMLESLWPQVRSCYTHLPDKCDYMSSSEVFTEMLLHDGCYLLSFFIDFTPLGGAPDNNKQIIAAKDNTSVRDILYLLENQIPLFVLQRVLEHLTEPETGGAISVLELIARPVENLLQQQLYISETMWPVPSESVPPSDLLHLVYSYFRLTSHHEMAPPLASSLTGRWRRATDYSRYAALRFRRRVFERNQEWTILDIRLDGGTLQMPFLRVGSTTWTMLRNLMALEEQQERRPVTAYCCFMSQVACTAEDVDLLQRANVLEHYLGSDEQAAKGFAELFVGMALDRDNLQRNYLKPVWHNLEKRCSKPVHNLMGLFFRAGGSGGGSESEPALDAGLTAPPAAGFSQHQSPPLAPIPKVRERLRRVRGELFTPQTTPIGPYYPQSKDSFPLPWMMQEKKKEAALFDLYSSLLDGIDNKLQDKLGARVIECYNDLPDHYSKDPKAFNHMLLRDGCYLLSLFIKFWPQTETLDNNLGGGRTDSKGDDESKILTQDKILVRDILFLLENQIPLVVLWELLNFFRGPLQLEHECFLESIARPVEYLLQKQFYISETTRPPPHDDAPSDLLHLVHCYFRRPHGEAPRCSLPGRRLWRTDGAAKEFTGLWRGATYYRRYADLRFRRRVFERNQEWTILDIELDGGTLYIPFLQVDNCSWTMLRNLMALEENQDKRPVTAYCLFMSQVASTAEDIELLQRAKILEHFLGSDEQAAKGFADLCDGVVLDMNKLDRNYLKPIWHKLDKRCRKSVHNFKALFRENYCGNLFQRLVFSVAVLIFILQVVQVIYAALAYHKPPKAP